MVKSTTLANFKALDACHRQTLDHLRTLAELAGQLDAGKPPPGAADQARAIDAFFSGTSRAHHQEEEETVFPALLHSNDAELVQAVRSLQQDHGWIERNWSLLGPQLRAIASGESWPEPAEFQHGVEVFLQLCLEHIALEETLVYPASRARWAQVVAQRTPRAALSNG